MQKKLENIEVMISHPWVANFIPLTSWIETGPDPREFVAPIRARDKNSQQELPLSVIPLKYRNNRISRLFIRLGLLENPWGTSHIG